MSSRPKSPRRSKKKYPSNSSRASSHGSLPNNLNKYINEHIDPRHPRAATHKNNVSYQIHQAQKLLNRSLPHNVTRKNRKAAQEAKRQNSSQLNHMDFRVRKYITPILATIREQLKKVQTILYNIQYTNKHVNDWSHRDINILEGVKQTLLNALHVVLYPKEKLPQSYDSYQNAAVFTRSDHNRVNPFFEPVMKTIKEQLTEISHAIYKLAYPKNGKVYKYNKEHIEALEHTKQHMLDLSHMIPHENEIIII
jgi:hypothetical protein